MKKLTYSAMAAARLRANKRQYLSLVLGIFLSIFLVSTLVFSIYGIYLAELDDRREKVGYLDFVIMDNDVLTDEQIAGTGDYDRMGHAYISGVVTDRNVYVGHYDDIGKELLDLKAIEGRLPDSSGEIAVELSAMDVLGVAWTLGETVELSITPIDGAAESRTFILVGILPERSVHLDVVDYDGIGQFPAILISGQENAFATGRIGVHNLMEFGKTGSIGESFTNFWKNYPTVGLTAVYGLNLSGDTEWGFGGVLMGQEVYALIVMACVLACSLILSCGVGISGSMEGILMKRREEIGVLRALGATRRQIRRIFGRENLLIAGLVSPLSILVSLGAMWGLSLAMPDDLKFGVNVWLVAPIAVFSVTVILIAGFLPLVRASKQMPMSVIRDTAMLRRSKRVKSKKSFSPTRLIASRQLRFHPTRQIGAMLLVGLMLLCSGLVSSFLYTYTDYTARDYAGFVINKSYGYEINQGVVLYQRQPLSTQSIAQIENLPHVESIRIDREMDIIAQVETVPRYAMLFGHQDQYGMLDDEMFQEAVTIAGVNSDWILQNREQMRKGYLQMLETWQFEGQAFQMSIMTMDLSKDTVRELKNHLADGSVNVEAINAGTQVLILAPEIWMFEDARGRTQLFDADSPAYELYKDQGAVPASWNDCFMVGQTLPLTQLYSENVDYSNVVRNDTTVQVCGILDSLGDLAYNSRGNCVIITTEAGLANMGLRNEGLDSIEVFTDTELSLEVEERLERQLSAIVRRNEGFSVQNYMEYARQRAQTQRQELILFTSIAFLFFVVSVGMIVSAATRQLGSEGRTIGMLRAVGADEKAILGCYSGQLYAGIMGGMGIAVVIFFTYLIGMLATNYTLSLWEWWMYSTMIAVVCMMGVLCLVVCKFLLRLRIREILKKSIIDNIREL